MSRSKVSRRKSFLFFPLPCFPQASQEVLVVKNPPAKAGLIRDEGSICGSGRPPGGGRGNPLQSSCLENPMDRGAWRATVHRVAQSQIRLKRLSMHARFPLELTVTPEVPRRKERGKQDGLSCTAHIP